MTVSVRILVLSLVLGAGAILAQDSSGILTIQTSPPEPTSSGSGSISGSPSLSSSGSASSSANTTTSAPGSTASTAAFPQQCNGQCEAIATSLATCGSGDALNTTCLCTPAVEKEYQTCLQCAIAADPTAAEQSVYQAAMDAFINQCANAPNSPVTLSNVTITLPSTSSSHSASSSSASASTTTSQTSSSIPSSSSPTSSASAAPSASPTGGSNAATRRTGNALMSVGLAGVMGAVIAAAAV